MEAIFSIIAYLVGIVLVGIVLGFAQILISKVFKTAKVAAKTPFSKKSLKDNLEEEFSTDDMYGKTLIKIEDEKVDGLIISKVMIKGLLPDVTLNEAYWGVKIYDATDKIKDSQKLLLPVISVFNDLRETDSLVFDFKSATFAIQPGLLYPKLIPLALFYPQMLQAPYSGNRTLRIMIYLGSKVNPVLFKNGNPYQENAPFYFLKYVDKEIYFEGKGYLEALKNKEESIALSIQLAVAVAMSDGNLDEKEGYIIKEFIQGNILFEKESKRKKLKESYNESFKSSFKLAKSGKLKTSSITKKINDIATKTIKYDAIELCYDVMSADGVAEKSELMILDKITKQLNLDVNIVSKIKDKSLLKLDSSNPETTDIETILGIDSSWNKEQINTHLKKEFKKWNSRYQNLSAGKERENAQLMLDYIAQARKKND